MADLMKLLEQREAADQVYLLTCEILNLHATQGKNEGFTPLRRQSISETSDSTHTEGTKEKTKVPVQRRRGRRKEKETEVQTYFFERNGKPKTILLEIGGPYGLFAKTLRDAVVGMNKAQYWMPTLSLIRFEAVDALDAIGRYTEVKVKTTIDSSDPPNDKAPKPRMEPRNSRGAARSMVPVFHERVAEPFQVRVRMIINSECPRNLEEVASLLHAMRAMASGAAKRAFIRIVKAEEVK